MMAHQSATKYITLAGMYVMMNGFEKIALYRLLTNQTEETNRRQSTAKQRYLASGVSPNVKNCAMPYTCGMYVCIFGSHHVMTMTTVNLQNQLTNVSGPIQAYLCEPRICCN